MTQIRCPETPGREEQLQQNQENFIRDPVVKGVLSDLILSQSEVYGTFTETFREMSLHYRDPHPKKKLRIDCYDEMYRTGSIADKEYLRSVWVKLKREEIAKEGKYPRVIGDMGVAASLQGFVLTEFLKEAQYKHPLRLANARFEFIKKADPGMLAKAFDCLLDPPGDFYFCYFSDDACLSMRDDRGTIHTYNLDISSCDSSHTSALFKLLERFVPVSYRDGMKLLVDQCRKPMRVVDVNNRGNVVQLQPLTPRLYSGSTITTAINNIANLLIGLSIYLYSRSMSIIEAAAECGYVVTLDECHKPEDIQFLKHSPAQDVKGKYAPVCNLGVLVRCSGNVCGDVPGTGPLKRRATEFQKGILSSYAANCEWPMLTTMRRNVSSVSIRPEIQKAIDRAYGDYKEPKTKRSAWKAATGSCGIFTDDAILARYDLTDEEKIDVLKLKKVGYGEIIGNPALGRVLNKDYGLDCNLFDTSTVDTSPVGEV